MNARTLIREVAKRHNMAVGTLVAHHGPRSLRPARIEVTHTLKNNGYTVTNIARILRRDRHMIYNWLSPRASNPPRPILSKRQYEVAKLVSKGVSNKLIAHQLGISEGVVKNYLQEIFLRLRLSNRTELAVWMLQHKDSEE